MYRYTRALNVVAAFLIVTVSAPLLAQANDETRDLVRAATRFDEMESQDARTGLIDSAEAYCTALEREFPKNSPAEDEWLDDELRGAGNRPRNALGSVEMVRRIASNFTGECLFFVSVARVDPNSPKGFVGLAMAFDKADGNLHTRADDVGVNPETFGLEIVLRIARSGFLRAAYVTSD